MNFNLEQLIQIPGRKSLKKHFKGINIIEAWQLLSVYRLMNNFNLGRNKKAQS
jgi:hypothetical protein